jgi:MFS family permease
MVFWLTHAALQLPSGRASDRFGPRSVGLAAVALIIVGNGLALGTSDPVLAIVARSIAGVGTGLGIVSGSDYMRLAAGGALGQALGHYAGVFNWIVTLLERAGDLSNETAGAAAAAAILLGGRRATARRLACPGAPRARRDGDGREPRRERSRRCCSSLPSRSHWSCSQLL